MPHLQWLPVSENTPFSAQRDTGPRLRKKSAAISACDTLFFAGGNCAAFLGRFLFLPIFWAVLKVCLPVPVSARHLVMVERDAEYKWAASTDRRPPFIFSAKSLGTWRTRARAAHFTQRRFSPFRISPKQSHCLFLSIPPALLTHQSGELFGNRRNSLRSIACVRPIARFPPSARHATRQHGLLISLCTNQWAMRCMTINDFCWPPINMWPVHPLHPQER